MIQSSMPVFFFRMPWSRTRSKPIRRIKAVSMAGELQSRLHTWIHLCDVGVEGRRLPRCKQVSRRKDEGLRGLSEVVVSLRVTDPRYAEVSHTLSSWNLVRRTIVFISTPSFRCKTLSYARDKEQRCGLTNPFMKGWKRYLREEFGSNSWIRMRDAYNTGRNHNVKERLPRPPARSVYASHFDGQKSKYGSPLLRNHETAP